MVNMLRTDSARISYPLKLMQSDAPSNRTRKQPQRNDNGYTVIRLRGGNTPGKFPQVKGRTRDKIAAFAGISGRNLSKIRAVVGAAEREPKKFGPLVAEMDRTRRIDAVYRKLRQMQDEEKRLSVAPIKGRFRTLVVDPPWRYTADQERKFRPIYSTMSQAELLALRLAECSEEDSHLYLWTTNARIKDALALMESWGFTFVTILTWVKSPPFGLGGYFRTTTEHVLFGVRGPQKPSIRKSPTPFTKSSNAHPTRPSSTCSRGRSGRVGAFGARVLQRRRR